MKELSLFDGRIIMLNDGRIVRFSKDKLEFEELINNKWESSDDTLSLKKAFSDELKVNKE